MERHIAKKPGELHAAIYPPGSMVKVLTLAKGGVLVVVEEPQQKSKCVDEPQELCVTS